MSRLELDLIVFDFDGTVCDSAGIKDEAFRLLYLDEMGEEFADRVQSYHIANAGVSRFDKIIHIEEQMLGREGATERLDAVAARFGALVEDQVVAAPLIDGAQEFLDTFHSLHTLTVASATPTDELRRIVARRELGRYFAAVDGSPATKGTIILDHMTRFSSRADRTVMVGDQTSDHRAAEFAGVGFVGVGSDAPRGGATVAVIDDLSGLESVLDGSFS